MSTINSRQHLIHAIDMTSVVIVMGDMNAKVGEDNLDMEGVMGKHGLGNINDNGERLCDFCSMNGLVITGTCFPHRTAHKATWVSPN